MQSLQPLSVVDITLPSRNCARLARIRKNDFKPSGLQHLVRGDPIHAGRFHHNRLRAGRNEPIGHALQISGKSLKRLHLLARRSNPDDGDHVDPWTDINTGRKRMNDRQP
ncbi:hypothetical protein P9292_03690 [Caballeronia sp. LZ001]|nr:hypothetical protein [Caballeronia sp. LZ001]MDR5799184.1 hypothetical protein [Caballeronia sp. LZ001]